MSALSAMSGHPGDLTAKARIRNVALGLYADFGEDATSMRAIARAAGVTVGLVVHHFVTKDGLRRAVEQHIVELFVQAISQVPDDLRPEDVAAAHDAAVATMLAQHPAVIGYLRRSLLDPTGYRGQVLEMLTRLTADYVLALREAGVASSAPRDSSQVIRVMIRQFGQMFLQPMIDTMWEQLDGPGAVNEDKPRVVVRIEESKAAAAR